MNSTTHDASSQTILPGGEVGSFSPADVFSRLRGHGPLIALAAILGISLGYGASFAFVATFESEVDLQVGTVHGQLIENSAVLAEHLESEGLRRTFEAELGQALPVRAVQVEAVGPAEAGASAYLRVVARHLDPTEAQRIAQHLATFVENRHAQAFEQVSIELAGFQAKLAEGLARLDGDVAAIQHRLGEVATEQHAMAALLLQSNLSAARTQQIELRKQLRDSQIAQTLGTRRTRALGPPSVPRTPGWPSRPLFALLGGVMAVAMMVVGSLVRR